MSGKTELINAGFQNPQRAEKLLKALEPASFPAHWLPGKIGKTPDPDACLLHLVRLWETVGQKRDHAEILLRICADEDSADRLFALLGYSSFLSDLLISHPALLRVFIPGAYPDLNPDADRERWAVKEALRAAEHERRSETLRLHYWSRVMQVAAYDLTAPDPCAAVSQVCGSLSALAEATLAEALDIAAEEFSDLPRVKPALIALGKTGARELNYSSDVDLIAVVHEGDGDLPEARIIRCATEILGKMTQIVCGPGSVPGLWELDFGLRPEGKDGALVRTLSSYLTYYRRWAQGWEFQALLKARPIAGDTRLGREFVRGLQPLVWNAAERDSFVEETRAMRERVENLVPSSEEERQLKLGKGGLRDVEFTVQLLQLVHGRTDPDLRSANTWETIAALAEKGYISRAHGEELAQSYRFFRVLEHRIQLRRFRRTHLVPRDPAELARIGRSIERGRFSDPVQLENYRRDLRRKVRKLHMALYYRPLLPEMAKLSKDDVSLDPQAARQRLAAIGYRDPQQALAHISALGTGISRTAAIQRQILPVMMGWFGSGPEPDQGLKAFRILSEKMGGTSWYMRTLRDSGSTAKRLARLLSESKYIARELPALPESISWLGDDRLLVPRTAEEMRVELNSLLSRRTSPAQIVLAGRYLRRKELLRTALAQALNLTDTSGAQRAIANAADMAVQAGVKAAIAQTEEECAREIGVRFAVIAMGRYGGRELTYSSDADVLFVYRGEGGNEARDGQDALRCAQNFMRLLQSPGEEPALEVDANLRPEGRNGALARSVAGYRDYYLRWCDTWERQALLRARFCAGDSDVGKEFLDLIDPVRYPREGLSVSAIRDVRMLKLRMEKERLPRGPSAADHLKLGPGGLSDTEWTVQLLQLRHAARIPALRTVGTADALREAERAGLLGARETEILREAWMSASRLRDLNILATGSFVDSKVNLLLRDPRELACVASMLGLSKRRKHDVIEHHLHKARLARQITERIFYGDTRQPR